ncbi:hypothetical protein ACIOHC_36260 [Streptomyces sp. NPDC088252]|uniref:hypothetical protein n=1 Tax=Streptomyces sp. NPDC088252 TaxID=3365845 RepID=UPI0037F85B47
MRMNDPQLERGYEMAKEFSAEEVIATLREWGGTDDSPEAFAWLWETTKKMNMWLQRGDGIAIYENQDLCHSELGDKKFTSFGSTDAQLVASTPPEILPDGVGGTINWRYTLIGTYKGDPLSI